MGEPLRDQYIVLPSNVKHIEGEKINKPNNFKVPLDRPLELDKTKWEVGLAEINYPHSWGKAIKSSKLWYNFQKINYKFVAATSIPGVRGGPVAMTPAIWDESDVTTTRSKTIDKNKDLYTIEEVIQYLNDIKPDKYDGNFILSANKKTVKIKIKGGELIHLSKSLKTLLGYNSNWISSNTENAVLTNLKAKIDPWPAEAKRNKNPAKQVFRITAPNRVDMDESKYNMFVYCNLVENSIVGDTQVPLLRSIPVTEKDRAPYISQYFEDKRYLPLSSNFFQAIEIQITDEYGELIDFQYGKVIVTVHLRQIKK